MMKNKRSRKSKKNKFLLPISLFVLLLCGIFYGVKLHNAKNPSNTNKLAAENSKNPTNDGIPRSVFNEKKASHDDENRDLRKFPYPYNSMLALCSDIDDTTLEDFKLYHQFLNTKENTPYGEGLGLDVGDSMWLYAASDLPMHVDKEGHGIDALMTYYKGTDITKKHNANEITNFIKSGWIDSLHTFGDFSTESERWSAFRRSLAESGWKTLKEIGFKSKVWINHGNRSNKQNFGAAQDSAFMSYQQGDNSDTAYYHTDVTVHNGIRYVWNSSNSDVFGHDFPLFPISLRDGNKVWGFPRYTNESSGGKIDWTWVPKQLYRQLTPEHLNSIVENKQYSIVAQHFGISTEDLFREENINALKLLKQYQDEGKVLVAKTSRLLDYANAYKYIKYNKVVKNSKTYINIFSIDDPIFGKSVPTIDNLRGVTFYTETPENTVLLLGSKQIDKDNIQVNPKDETEKASISIKWFNQDYTDYAKTEKTAS